MALAPGTRLGAFDVVAQIGQGGMGEVYRATDTKLGRDVALKILPDAFADDGDRLARFRREAHVLAALNHPGIAHIYGLEETTRQSALVMELVEGPTLADRIARGALPVDEALAIARQIAEALEAAHGQGIIHRDLKPSNVKVQDDGTVKVLDFGLAKALDPAPGDARSQSESPTITSPVQTLQGVILGTAAYMAPEQARGRTVDKRADVWAFGCVLYEMLTGRRALEGDDVQDTLANVLKAEPDLDALPDAVEPRVRQVIRGCLQRAPKDRLADMQDVRLALDGVFETRVPVDGATSSSGPRPWALAGAMLLGALLTFVALWSAGRRPADSAPQVRRSIYEIPADLSFARSGPIPALALSPDGETLVYRVDGAGLHRRTFDQLTGEPIAGTAAAGRFYFSHDGTSLWFQRGRSLMEVPLSGGEPVAKAQFPSGGVFAGGTWEAEDVTIVAQSNALYRVTLADGLFHQIYELPPDEGRFTLDPDMLPGGRHVLFTASAPEIGPSVKILDLDTLEAETLVPDAGSATYLSSGHLVFARGGRLFVTRFDEDGPRVVGQATQVESPVRSGALGLPQFAIGGNALAYLPTVGQLGELLWAGPGGVESRIPLPPARYGTRSISPDGRRLAVTIEDDRGSGNIGVVDDLLGSLLTVRPVASEAADETNPVWRTNSEIVFGLRFPSTSVPTELRSIVFGGNLRLHRLSADAGASLPPEPLRPVDPDRPEGPPTFTPDGRYAILAEGGDLWRLNLDDPSDVTAVLATEDVIESAPALSPDGGWLAYTSTESGPRQVYLRPFPGNDARGRPVTVDGGLQPVWSPDGRALFYRSGSDIVRVPITGGAVSGAPEPVVTDLERGHEEFDVAPDGRFLITRSHVTADEALLSRRIVIVLNWTEELKRLLPRN